MRWGTNPPWVIPTIKDGEALISCSCCFHSLQKHPHSVSWRSKTHRTLYRFAVSSQHLSREGCWTLHSLSWQSKYCHGENWWALQTPDGFTSWATRKYAPYTYALAPFLLGWLVVSYPCFWQAFPLPRPHHAYSFWVPNNSSPCPLCFLRSSLPGVLHCLFLQTPPKLL